MEKVEKKPAGFSCSMMIDSSLLSSIRPELGDFRGEREWARWCRFEVE